VRSAWHKDEAHGVDQAQTNLIRCAAAAKEPLFRDTKANFIETTSPDIRRRKGYKPQTMGRMTDRNGEEKIGKRTKDGVVHRGATDAAFPGTTRETGLFTSRKMVDRRKRR